MRTIDAIRISGTHLRQTRTRSGLTILGVIIGIGAIVLLVSLGVGLQRIATGQLASFEMLTTINVLPKKGSDQTLNQTRVEEFKKIDGVEMVSPVIELTARVRYKNASTGVVLDGLKREAEKVEGLDIVAGRIFNQEAAEVVLSRALLKTLGQEDEAMILGERVKFKIISLKAAEEKKEVSEFEAEIVGIDSEEKLSSAYIPLVKAKEIRKNDIFDKVNLKVKDRKSIERVKEKIEKEGFSVSTLKDLIDRVDRIFLIFEIILALIGSIGLFVASLGIINTMTISLLERTHEVGVMKAVGASNRDIKRIFIWEAALIGFWGGFFGVLGGFLLGQLFNYALKVIIVLAGSQEKIVPFVTPLFFALVILIFAVLIGIVTGLLPAKRAAKLSPMEALRVE